MYATHLLSSDDGDADNLLVALRDEALNLGAVGVTPRLVELRHVCQQVLIQVQRSHQLLDIWVV